MSYTPRLSRVGMEGSQWWYSSGNWFWANGYGLPNCTCYAYGRWGEILGAFENLPLRNAGWWYTDWRSQPYQHGLPTDPPALGAIMCWHSPTNPDTYRGHVAIVEVIHSNGDVTISQSGYPSPYFWTTRLSPSNGYLASWMRQGGRDYVFQGFIYLPGEPVPPPEPPGPEPPGPEPPTPTTTHKMPLWMMLKRY